MLAALACLDVIATKTCFATVDDDVLIMRWCRESESWWVTRGADVCRIKPRNGSDHIRQSISEPSNLYPEYKCYVENFAVS